MADHPANAELTAVLQLINPIIDTASSTFRRTFANPKSDVRLPAGFTVHLKLAE